MGSKARKRRAHQKTKLPPVSESPGVDVVIPVFGQLELLDRCLMCLDQSRGAPPLHIVLVDDQGTPPVKTMDFIHLEHFGRPRIIVNRQNLGFGESCNRGVRVGHDRLVLLLNSDVELEPNALEIMVDEFENPTVGVVGIKLLFPPTSRDARRPANTIQHAGIAVNFEGKPFHIHLGWPADDPRPNQRREMQAVTGACMMVKRELWKKIGGFDPVYRRGTFEDIEFCLMVKGLEHKVIYQPRAVGIHEVGASAVASGIGFPVQENFMVWSLRCSGMAVWDEWRFW